MRPQACSRKPAIWTRFREIADDARPGGDLILDAHLAA
jgi:hypothetical protein